MDFLWGVFTPVPLIDDVVCLDVCVLLFILAQFIKAIEWNGLRLGNIESVFV